MSTSTTATAASHLHVAIIGAGFSGLGMAIRLKQTGNDDFLIFEKEAGVGGTWRVNNYPGCACDVQSHLYSFSFEPNPNWSRMFAPQPEIKAYLERCSEKYQLTPHLRLNQTVQEIRWDDAANRWHITTASGARYTANVVLSGMGGLSTPAVPNLPGLAKFQGQKFHSQQWDHDYDLKGKRVAVIGTGASAIQFVPQIQPQVARLDLYQRTPPWIMPKPDRSISALEQLAYQKFPKTQQAMRAGLYSLLESRAVAFVINPGLMKVAEQFSRSYLQRKVKDPVLRKKLTPDYMLGCKRVLISSDYYPALAQPNVEVITTGIREIRANSVVTTDGQERPVDALIFGTGFQATDPLPRGVVFGRGGVDLLDSWTDGPEAYKGTATKGFPNLFFLVGPNTGLGHNSMVYMIESQITYVLDALRVMKKQAITTLEVKAEVQRQFNAELQEKAKRAIWSVGGCKSWYLHPVTGRNVTLWPGFTWAFRYLTRRFDTEAYHLRRNTTQAAPTDAPRKAASRRRSTAAPQPA